MLYGRQYWRQCKPIRSKLERAEVRRCCDAVDRWVADPRHPGLNFERLGSGPRQNHWSIRASKELRVILAVEGLRGRSTPRRFAPVNMGHHDPMYEWAKKQRYRTDFQDCVELADELAAAGSGAEDGGSASRPPVGYREWMLFPTGQQRWHIQRTHAGAARVRGSAGSGKTVVALHRAAFLGHKFDPGRVLVTTFSRSLCNYMAKTFRELPDAPENVDFINIDRLASKLVPPSVRVDLAVVDQAFDQAFREAVPDDVAARFSREYLKEEVCRVIKGRDAKQEEYLDAGRFERFGRKRPMKRRDREVCWRLREMWDQCLRRQSADTFEDRLIQARNWAWEAAEPMYRAAILDEGQDMTLVGVQLVRALVAGRPENRLPVNGLLVLDDSAQRIYPGGYKPKWAQLDFTGNSKFLRRNYRNCKAIYNAARAVRGSVVVGKDDNDDGSVEAVEFERGEGRRPTFIPAEDGECPAILKEIRRLADKREYSLEEIAVLTRRNANVKQLVEYLGRRGLKCVNLRALKSPHGLGSGIRVGTFDRAKGLEFRAVFIARLGRSVFPLDREERGRLHQGTLDLDWRSVSRPAPLTDEEKERSQLHLDRLYVAMTRARDLLYLVSSELPCEEVARAKPHFRVSSGGFPPSWEVPVPGAS